MFSHIDLEHFRITHFKGSDLPAHFRLEMTWEKGRFQSGRLLWLQRQEIIWTVNFTFPFWERMK